MPDSGQIESQIRKLCAICELHAEALNATFSLAGGGVPSAYDLLNAPQVESRLLLRRQKCPAMERASCRPEVVEARCAAARDVLDNPDPDHADPTFLAQAAEAVELARALLASSQGGEAYDRWLTSCLPANTKSADNKNDGHQTGPVPTEPGYQPWEPPASGSRSGNQTLGETARSPDFAQEDFVLTAGYEPPAPTLQSAQNLSNTLRYLLQKALNVDTPDKVKELVEEALNLLHYYEIGGSYPIYRNSRHSQSGSWTEGPPNPTIMREVRTLATRAIVKWSILSETEQDAVIQVIRAKLEPESQIFMEEWIYCNSPYYRRKAGREWRTLNVGYLLIATLLIGLALLTIGDKMLVPSAYLFCMAIAWWFMIRNRRV